MEEEKKCARKEIGIRLRKIEGQVKGIEKMVESEVGCKDILIQVAAIRAAINKVGSMILENYAKDCLCEGGENANLERVDELMKTLNMFIK